MEQLLTIRDAVKRFISRNETYIIPTGKFLLAMFSLILINSKIGYAAKLTSFAVVVIISLVCSFLPANFIVLLCGAMMLLHLYSLSLECVIVVGVLLIVMYLIYFRFSPGDTLFFLLTPICFALKIPYVIPISAGLVSGVTSGASVGCGVIIYYILAFINNNVDTLKNMKTESMVEKIRFLVDELLFNKEMLVYVIGFAVTIIVVNIIRRLTVNYAWTIAIVIGTMSNIVIVLAGDIKFGTYISVAGLILGSIFAVIVVAIIKFFVFNVDYKRTEIVQFEDDEYYYYVKAVPKNTGRRVPRSHKKLQNKQPLPRRNTESERIEKADKTDRKSAVKTLKHSDGVKKPVSGKSGTARSSSQGRSDLLRQPGESLTEIERAAAAKARASRNKHD